MELLREFISERQHNILVTHERDDAVYARRTVRCATTHRDGPWDLFELDLPVAG
jgi:hypothetical protein